MADVESSGAEPSPGDEVGRLREENEVLRSKAGRRERGGPAWRRFLVWLLVILASLSALFGVFAVWMRAVTLNTNTFTTVVAPLIKNDQVATAVSDEAVTRLFEQQDVAAVVKRELPSQLKFASKPITGGIESLAELATKSILKTDQFQVVWRNILKVTHASAVRLIRSQAIKTEPAKGQDKVVLDLSQLMEAIRVSLIDNGVTALKKAQIPSGAGQIILFRSNQFRRVRQGVRTLDTLNWALPLAAFVLFVLAVVAAKDRRRALLKVGAGLVIAMALALIFLNVGQGYVLGTIKKPDVHAAANVIWNSVWNGFVIMCVVLLVVGALVIIGTVLMGPYPWAVRLRSRFTGYFTKRAPGVEV